MKDEYRGEYTRCRYHPKQEVIGVCHLCLHHRLLLLAAAAKHDAYSSSSGSSSRRRKQMLSGISLPKLFALQLPSLDSYKRPRPHRPDDLLTTSSTLQDESFISIKFGDNGEASWDKSKKSTKRKVSSLQQQQQQDCSTTRTPWGYRWGKSVVEHGKPRSASLRWRKRISQLIQVIRGKKPAARRHC